MGANNSKHYLKNTSAADMKILALTSRPVKKDPTELIKAIEKQIRKTAKEGKTKLSIYQFDINGWNSSVECFWVNLNKYEDIEIIIHFEKNGFKCHKSGGTIYISWE